MTMAHDIHAHGDILIGSLPLNYIDEDGCRWIVQDVTGWWETPPAIIPEDERPYNEDGNYWTAGRYGPRTIQINGVVVPPPSTSELGAQRLISEARDKINREINLVRKTGVLTFHEVDASRQIEVQLLGQPLISTTDSRNVLHFDLQFIASDPRKKSITKRSSSATMMNIGVGGRKYPRAYPRRYQASVGSNRTFVTNDGDTISYGVLRISGPITNPRVDHAESGQFIKVNLTLGPNDYLDIDMQNKTVMLNNTESRAANLDFDSTWFPYLPGDNTLLFTGTTPAAPQEGWAAATNLITNPSAEQGGTLKSIHYNHMRDPSFTSEDTILATTRENIADNPIFEPDKSDIVTNLVANPAGRNVDGTVVVRENLCKYPLPVAPDWGPIRSDSVTTETEAAGQFVRLNVANGPNSRLNLIDAARRSSVQPGNVYTLSFMYRTTTAQAVQGTIYYYDASGNPISANSGDEFPSSATWARASALYTAPENAVSAALWIAVLRTEGGEQADFKDVLFEKADRVLPYFDGDISPDPDLTPEWIGDPNTSPSRLIAPSPSGITSVFNGVSYYSQSQDAIAVLRLNPNNPSSSTYAVSSAIDSWEVGTTYTAFVEMWSDALTSMRVRTYKIGTTPLNKYFTTDNGRVIARATGTAVDTGAYVTANIDGDYINVGDVVYFRYAFVPGDYSGPYFDGSTQNEDPIEYAWTGAPDNSSSTRISRTVRSMSAPSGTSLVSSAEWAAEGDYSIKIVPTSEDNNTYVDVTPTTPLQAGQRYTISASMFETAPLTGTLHEYARSIVLTHSEGTVYAPAPAEGGKAVLLTSIPADATNIRLRLYNGSGVSISEGLDGIETTGQGSIHWDQLAIIPGETRPDFFYHGTQPYGSVSYSKEGVVSVEKRPTSRWWVATNNSSAYIDQESTSDLVVEFVTGAEVETSAAASYVADENSVMTLGAMVTTSVDTLVTPYLFSTTISTPGNEVRVPAGVPTYVRSSIPVPENQFKTGFSFSVASGSDSGLVTARLNSVILADGRYEGPYFDLDTGLTGFEIVQAGTPVAARAPEVTGYTTSPEAVIYKTPEWKAYGQHSMAVEKADSVIEVSTTYAELTSPAWNSLPNGPYTIFATVFAQPGEYKEGEEARTIEVYDQGTDTLYRSSQAVPGENSTIILRFTKSTNTGYIRFISNALHGEKVFWDGILLVAGDYSDRYFDGDSEGASWADTAHSSRSSQSARLNIPAATLYTEHRDSWIK